MPEEQINNLLATLRAHQDSIFEIGVYLSSYTFEVDDALREPYHSRDIIINDTTLCFASWVNVTSKIGVHETQSKLVREEEEVEIEEFHEEQSFEQRAHQELLQAINTNLKPLKNLAPAIWVLIVVIVLGVFFR